MAADTLVKEDFRPRRVAGGVFIFLGLPTTLITARFGLAAIDSLLDGLILASGPLMIIGGLWLAFPRRRPLVKLRISDAEIEAIGRGDPIRLRQLDRITIRKPLGARHDRMTLISGDNDVSLDIHHMTHEARDILKLISIRLECQGRFLREGQTAVRGAPNGIWEVLEGAPFEDGSIHANLQHGRE